MRSGNHEYLFTSESITEGHPDKVADQISDAVLDAILEQDKNSRVACETMVTTGMAMIAGEITTNAQIDYPTVVREAIKEIGYNHHSMGFDWETCAILTSLDRQADASQHGDPAAKEPDPERLPDVFNLDDIGIFILPRLILRHHRIHTRCQRGRHQQ